MFKVGDRVVVVKNKLGGPNTFVGQRGVVNELSDEHFGVGVRTESYGVASFFPSELEFEETYDAMSAPHPDEMSEEEKSEWADDCRQQKDSLFSQEVDTRHDDVVSHPSHYTSHPSGVECKDVAGHYSFNVGSAIKYLWRHLEKHDDPITDLKKARQFLAFEIERLGGTTD